MTALNRLEVAAGISIIDKLAPKFVAMAWHDDFQQ